MDEEAPISVRGEVDLLREGQFRWTLLRAGRTHIRSSVCYPSRQEVEQAASRALKAHVARRALS
jgi:uncharacterized protein YegP (UPF0339 family)